MPDTEQAQLSNEELKSFLGAIKNIAKPIPEISERTDRTKQLLGKKKE